MEFLTPEIFDALIITNIVVGVLIAGRKFYKDVTGPLPDDAPPQMRDDYNTTFSSSSPSNSDS
jgi:hypothetical protein